MSKNMTQRELLEMGNRRSRSPAHEHATQAVAPKPADGLNNDNGSSSNSGSSSSSSQTCSNNKPFVADELNIERRVVLQLREDCSLKDPKSTKIHAAFEIYNVAATVASFCPLPPFELKDELLKSFEQCVSKRKLLSTADRYALRRVTRIGDRFLRGCVYLNTIDLSPLSNVTTVGDSFLCNSARLKTIDLSPLSNLTTVGDDFLFGCSGLHSIDVSPLSNLTTVGDRFLRRCSGIKTIDLTPLSNLTTVGNCFLSSCSGLNSIDWSPLSKLATVGMFFLSGCSDTVQAQGTKFLSRRGRE